MKKQNNLIAPLVALMMVIALTPLLQAQNSGARRIRFPRGSTSTSVRGTLGRDDVITYLVGARAGQTMTLEITRGAAIRLFTPSGEALQGGRGVSGADEELEETGDYRIEVESRSRRPRQPFTLYVIIR